jgi:hypothetical protein
VADFGLSQTDSLMLRGLSFTKTPLKKFIELSSSWEAVSCAATQEPLNILWNQQVHYHVYKSPPLDPIQSQINPVCTTPSYLDINHHLHLGLPSEYLTVMVAF